MVMPYCPYPTDYGAAIRTYYILRELAKRYEVSVALLGEPDSEAILRGTGLRLAEVATVPVPEMPGLLTKRLQQLASLLGPRTSMSVLQSSKRLRMEIEHLASARSFDLVHIEHFPLASHTNGLGSVPRVVDSHNVEYDNIRRLAAVSSSPTRRFFYRLESRKMKAEELRAYRSSTCVFAASDRDAEMLAPDLGRTPVVVIPNGVDTDAFAPPEGQPEPGSIVFVGALNYAPNSDGIGYFLREIFPLVKGQHPGVRLSIVGGGVPAWLREFRDPSVQVTGYVKDVRPYVHRASAVIVPLRAGGGTRLKVLEAMAAGKAIVSTSIGCEGIQVRQGESLLVADSAQEFADRLVSLLKDPEAARGIGARAREMARALYDWRVIGERIEEAYASVIAGG
jgi:glycosyltransferase involved in cell wall biosynthesis